MDVLEVFQEYFFKTKTGRANGADKGGENAQRCSITHGCCWCARKRDCGSSTYDLSTYIWYTEGDGVGINSSIRGDEGGCCSCRTGSSGQKGRGLSQSKCCEIAQGNMFDASTSTYDLSTFVWGTDGDVYQTAADVDEHVETFDFDQDSGNRDTIERNRDGVDRRRPRPDAFLGFMTPTNSSGLAAAPRHKKRRI